MDATFVAQWRAARRPIDDEAAVHLAAVLPEACAGAGVACAVPGLTPDSYAADALQGAVAAAAWIEPVDKDAFRSLAGSAPQAGQILTVPEHPGVTDVEPTAAAARDVGWTLEYPLRCEGTDSEALVAQVGQALARHPHDRVRVVDARGQLTPGLLDQLGALPRAAALTLSLHNPHGHAGYLAHHALMQTPLVVRSVLLGRAQGGAPATELLLPRVRAAVLRPAAEAIALIAQYRIDAEHPLWGVPGEESADMHALLHRHLADWGVTLHPHEEAAVLAALRRTIRPGDRVDGPTVYATVAAHSDLLARAAGAGMQES